MEWKNLEKSLRKYGLTDRECQISILSLQNVSILEIAERMGVLEKTVKWYLRNSYTKMKALNHQEFFRNCEQANNTTHESIVVESLERDHYLENHLRDAGLTKGEIAVALLMAQGMCNREIAQKLFVTEKTIKFHTTRLYFKMKVKSRSQFIVKCYALLGMTLENKLVSPKFLKPHDDAVELPFPIHTPVKPEVELPVGIATKQE